MGGTIAGIGGGPVGIENAGHTGIECFYYIRKDAVLYRLKKAEFKDNYEFLFGDDSELIAKINQKVLGFNDLEQIVAEYNARSEKMNKSIDPK